MRSMHSKTRLNKPMSIVERLINVIEQGKVTSVERNQLITNIGARQMELFAQGIFAVDLQVLQSKAQELDQARYFFELTTSFFYLIQDFVKADEHFSLLSFFYNTCHELLPLSQLQSKVMTLRLTHLYSLKQDSEFYSLYGSVPEALRNSTDFQHLDNFVYFMQIGNHVNAVKAISCISAVHPSILSQIEDNWRIE